MSDISCITEEDPTNFNMSLVEFVKAWRSGKLDNDRRGTAMSSDSR